MTSRGQQKAENQRRTILPLNQDKVADHHQKATSTTSSQRRATVPMATPKRSKPRRQSGAAVEGESRESIVEKTRLERSDSDRVIRRNSMERKMSVRNSLHLPKDFLQGLKGLDASLTRMSLAGSVRGLGLTNSQRELLRTSFIRPTDGQGHSKDNHEDSNNSSTSFTQYSSNHLHGPAFTEEQLAEMSNQALMLSDNEDSGSELEVPMEGETEDEEEEVIVTALELA